jgi:transcriptional regulator with XRE-family HTH domain
MLDSKRLNTLLGDRVRLLREAQKPKMSQAQLAEILGLKRTSITNIELGKQKPTLDALYMLCEHFGLSIGDFIPEVVEVTQPSSHASSHSVVVGKQVVEVGSKTASALEAIRTLMPIRSNELVESEESP